ncbi:MAG: hypothetical protein HY209_01170 [Candidatus Omnitrophica bacterium]|nr:hypothetical protein [Candidatus Omnitrophota bacterium]
MNVKIISKISLIASVILLAAAISLYLQKQQAKNQNVSLQNRLDEATVFKQAIEKKLQDATNANASLDLKTKALQTKIDTLSQELEESKAVNMKLSHSLEAKEGNVKELALKLKDVGAKEDDLTARLAKANEDCLKVKSQAENFLKTKQALERKIEDLTQQNDPVPLGTIVVKQSSE